MSIVVARCSRCKGWTMFHAEHDSKTGRKWAGQCAAAGDSIEHIASDVEVTLGPACPSADAKPAKRTCGAPSMPLFDALSHSASTAGGGE